MEVVVQGKLIDTKKIWKIEERYGNPSYDEIGFRVGIIDDDDILFGREIQRGTHGDDKRQMQKPYNEAMQKLIKLWEQDKSEHPIINI